MGQVDHKGNKMHIKQNKNEASEAVLAWKFIALKVYIRNKENIAFVTIRFALKKKNKEQ